MNELSEEVQQVVANTVERIKNAQFTLHTPYEAYALLKHKYEDTKQNVHQVKGFLFNFWRNVKKNSPSPYAEALIHMQDCAIQCAINAMQIAATAQKSLDCIKEAKQQEQHNEPS